MWPFKKKALILNIAPKKVETIICIPGTWNSWSEFIVLLVASSEGEYIAAGNILMNAGKDKHYSIEFCEKDERMRDAFMHAGKVIRVTDGFLDQIEDHTYVIYISGATGSMEEAGHIAFAATAVLKAGGLGIKIETTGKAFEKDAWLNRIESFQPADLYQMFVVDSLIDKYGTVFSCGMHNLGYRDTIISGEEFQEAVSLISLFGYYQIVDHPRIQNGQTFSKEIGAPRFRITEELNQPYKDNESFGNPFGMWRLTRE